MRPVLALVMDARGAQRPGLVAAVVRGGVDWLQLRDRELEAADLLALADEVCAAADGARVVVNRRIDVCLATNADGVHLGFDAMDPVRARSLLGPEALVGVSVHAPEELDGPDAAAADYAHLAPIHAPLSKALERPPLGVGALAAAATRGLPVIAQGGIHADNARASLDAGAAGVAVSGAILLAEDPERAASALREALDA